MLRQIFRRGRTIVTGAPPAGDDAPVNARQRDTSDEALAQDVAYAVQVGEGYLRQIPGGPETLAGRRVLDIGPGVNFGSILLTACYGARPMVSDRFLAAWDPAYHPLVYRRLRDWLAEHRPGLDLSPLDRLLAAGGYGGVLECLDEPMEALVSIAAASVDMVFSNAVMEHIVDLDACGRELYRITSPGGLGFHQVDFRDHRDFSRPLEYLCMDDDAFAREFEECHGEMGNRLRPHEVEASFRRAGFDVREVVVTERIDPAYLADVEARLRRASGSRYRDTPVDRLEVIGARFEVARPA